jgi:putative transposase
MKTGGPKRGVCLSSEEKELLQSMVSSRSLRYGLLTRIRIVLLATEGASNREIGEDRPQCPVRLQMALALPGPGSL